MKRVSLYWQLTGNLGRDAESEHRDLVSNEVDWVTGITGEALTCRLTLAPNAGKMTAALDPGDTGETGDSASLRTHFPARVDPAGGMSYPADPRYIQLQYHTEPLAGVERYSRSDDPSGDTHVGDH